MTPEIAIVEAHHQVITHWSDLRRTLNAAPAVWTLDYHTDTMPCFRGTALPRLRMPGKIPSPPPKQ